LLGLYLLAAADQDPNVGDTKKEYLKSEVVYIGMSTNVDQRLERTHKAVARYCRNYTDPGGQRLWFSLWQPGWTNRERSSARRAVRLASIALYERVLLLAFATEHGFLPVLNRE